MKKLDDKKTSWELSIFFIVCAVLIAVANHLRGLGLDQTLDNPVFNLVLAALFLSLTYWLLRRYNLPKKKSAIIIGLLVAAMFLTSLTGIRFFVVMSNSMRHSPYRESYYTFWGERGYPKEAFDAFPISQGFQAGDMIVVRKTGDLKVGDVGVDLRPSVPVTHRIVFVNETIVMTMGDAAPLKKIPRREIRRREDVYGTVWFVIPKAGALKTLLSCHLDAKCSDYWACFNEGKCGGYTSVWT